MAYKPPIRHRMLDRCEVCGRKTHRADLVLQNQERLTQQGSNRFPYSSYSSTGWTCTATDGGATSYGTGVKMYMDTPGLSMTTMEQPDLIGGVQTWTGNGVIRSKTTACDASASTNICVSAVIGLKQDEDDAAISVVMGLTNSGYTVTAPQRTWAFTGGQKRVWFTVPVADITTLTTSALYAYFDVTCTGSWWIDEMAFELDAVKPGTFIETTGAAITNTADSRSFASHKVCKQCRRKKWDLDRGTTAVEPPDLWRY